LQDAGSRIDIATEPTPQPVTVFSRSRRRRLRPILAFIVSFAAVLTVGLAGGWIGGSGDGASPTGVFWHRVELDFVLETASGPGGFVATGVPAEQGVWLSADGVSWSQSSLPASDGAFVESILSTTDGWLIVGGNDEARLAWWSEDGRVWSQVDWPTAFEDSIQTIISSGEYFFALSNDVFDEGTTLWRSSDALTWTEIPAGPITPTSGFLEGVSGGLVFRDEANVWVSTDGNTWTPATLESPSELGEGRPLVVAVERLGNGWLAFIEVVRVDQDPVLAVMSSVNGEAWEFEGIPPFGQIEGLAAGIEATGTIGDRLVVIPVETPTSTQDDGTVVANGFVRNSGQVWSTTDGSNWALELSEGQDLFHVDGAVVDGRPIGIWVGLGGETEETLQTPVVTTTPSVVTTTAAMPDEPVDPDGLEFQAGVIEDGTVTFEEFEQAAEHWKTCMEEHGVTDVEYTIHRSGGMSSSYASPSPDGERENAISNLCDESWLNQVLATQAGY
jgi:hypothetical protein